MASITLTAGELRQVTGGKQHARRQLAELHARGFWRARLGVDGKVVLERAHYEAVCAGALPHTTEARDTSRPQLRPVERRKAA